MDSFGHALTIWRVVADWGQTLVKNIISKLVFGVCVSVSLKAFILLSLYRCNSVNMKWFVSFVRLCWFILFSSVNFKTIFPSEQWEMALGNGSTPAGGVTQEKAPVVNGTNMETLPRTGKQVIFVIEHLVIRLRNIYCNAKLVCKFDAIFNWNLKRNIM